MGLCKMDNLVCLRICLSEKRDYEKHFCFLFDTFVGARRSVNIVYSYYKNIAAWERDHIAPQDIATVAY